MAEITYSKISKIALRRGFVCRQCDTSNCHYWIVEKTRYEGYVYKRKYYFCSLPCAKLWYLANG